jgi:hypothetical protein
MAMLYPADDITSLLVVRVEKLGGNRDFKHELLR